METGGTSGLLISLINASSSTGSPNAVFAQNKAEEVQTETAQQILESIPDPESSVGQNVDVRV